LFTGLEVRAESPKSLVPDYSVARTVTIDSNLLMPDIAQVFTKTDHLEFSQHGSPFSTRLIPFMVTTCVDYASKYKSRSDVVGRVTKIGVAGLRQKIEMDMLNLLFCAGLESRIVRKWKWRNTKWKHNTLPYRKFILAPEMIEDFDQNLSEDFIYSDLLGKDTTFQKDLLAKHKGFDADLGLRIESSDGILLSQLPSLPPLMGVNTSFDFDPKTCKVTEKPVRVDGREVMHFAYFCAMGVLDHRSVTLLDLKNI